MEKAINILKVNVKKFEKMNTGGESGYLASCLEAIEVLEIYNTYKNLVFCDLPLPAKVYKALKQMLKDDEESTKHTE